MFDPEFYPTPKEIVEYMLKPYNDKISDRYILEPSAGSGNMLDVITSKISMDYGGRSYQKSRANKRKVYCIEQDPELSMILQNKGYKLVGTDFLDYKPQHMIDLIIMNPPFSNGDQHLLHAWDILEGGDIACLLNAETINNPFTQRRELLSKIIEDHGSVEMLGNVFSSAERKTDVEIALVRLSKEGRPGLKLEFEPNERESHADFTEELHTGNEVALNDKMGAYLEIYEKSKGAFAEYIKAKAKLNYYAGEFLRQEDVENLIKSAETESRKDKVAIYNSFVDELKMKAWDRIMMQMGLERYMTSSVRTNFNEFKKSQGGMDLTRENIKQLIMMLFQSSDNILNQAVIDVFDVFTAYHKSNRVYPEGWKTNSAWKVGKKVILPGFTSGDYSGYYSAGFHNYDKYTDIDRAMCYLSGIKYESLDAITKKGSSYRDTEYQRRSLDTAVKQTRFGDSSLQECEFFFFRCYKKGTVHLTFKSESLWAKFNQVACKGKFNLGEE